MKKNISITLIISQVLIFNNANAFDFDYDQFMRSARNTIATERNILVPSAIGQEYGISLILKSRHIDNTIKNFNISLNYLKYSFENFNKLYNSINIDSINNIDQYKDLLEKKNKLEKYLDHTRNALYTYRESEINLLSIKNSLTNYCEVTSKLIEPKGLVLTPLPYSVNTDFKPDLTAEDDKHRQALNNIYIGSAIIAGALSFVNPILGIAVGAVILYKRYSVRIFFKIN